MENLNRAELWRKLNKIFYSEHFPFQNRPNIPYRTSTKVDIKNEINKLEKKIKDILARKIYDESCKKYNMQALHDDKIKKYKIGDNCIICYNKLDNKQHKLPCGHVFHFSCVENMFFVYEDNNCPLCRASFLYDINISKKRKRRLKERIIKHLSNDFNLIDVQDIMSLFNFMLTNTEPCYIFGWMRDIISKIKLYQRRELCGSRNLFDYDLIIDISDPLCIIIYNKDICLCCGSVYFY